MMQSYEKLLDKISRISGLEKEEIQRRIEAKRAKLSGLISKEGAAQVIAAELGINFENEKLKLDELVSGMKKVNTVGKIISLFPVREFNKNGRSGKVANFFIADETSNVKVVLWDTNHIDLIEKKEINIGSVVEIHNATMRENEVHLGSFSELKKSDLILDEVKTERIIEEKKISDFKNMDNPKTRAFIVQVFEPKFFYVCSECKKKATQEGEGFTCQEHGKVMPLKRALLNIVIDDGNETIRAVLFNEAISSLGIQNIEVKEDFFNFRDGLLGKEMVFSGSIRNNKVFNNLEFVIDRAEEVNLEELIQGFEKKK
ncbi:MAG: DUF2240 family protein [archaeon]|nr:DUF2240 family protein [archaeon]